ALAQHIGFQVISEISDSGDNGIEGTGRDGTVKQHSRQSFPTIIQHNGEEKYFVDLTDTDLTLVSKLNSYNEHNFRMENKRRVLITIYNDVQEQFLDSSNRNLEIARLKGNDFNLLLGGY